MNAFTPRNQPRQRSIGDSLAWGFIFTFFFPKALVGAVSSQTRPIEIFFLSIVLFSEVNFSRFFLSNYSLYLAHFSLRCSCVIKIQLSIYLSISTGGWCSSTWSKELHRKRSTAFLCGWEKNLLINMRPNLSTGDIKSSQWCFRYCGLYTTSCDASARCACST